jgi:hypothetical protein
VALASAANAVADMASDLVGEQREHCEINQVEGPGRDVVKTTSLAGHDLTSSYDFSSLLAARVFGRDELSQAVCVQARKYESAMEPSVTGDGLDRSEPMRQLGRRPGRQWPACVLYEALGEASTLGIDVGGHQARMSWACEPERSCSRSSRCNSEPNNRRLASFDWLYALGLVGAALEAEIVEIDPSGPLPASRE